ncbi:hypothetical protein C0Q70_12472 [Pomacea canaliculata]|uniref:Uncharacterized protein n=1 Tax=Pomacea canaliculata TaxID=400727 RepID=A0A2T7P1N3_POMCA|nr:hypothetical protein C0Q70_12472 [Pomacea canaliculata]
MPSENVPEVQGGVCKLTPSSNDGCTFVNLSATTDTADDYLTPIIDFKAYMIQTRKTEGESTSDSPQSSASDEDGSPTRYRGHQNQGVT